ncbi:hypothetical protein GYA28_02255 [Candidatus Roizmanbacteria bacterium]|nr:hypothetical protein [Candidatus Roizmanbacteria bacterium]
MDYINNLKIPDVWQIIISILSSIGLVYIIEWLKQPSAFIEKTTDSILPDGRKMLKVKVKISKKGFLRKIFPWTNMASYARLKGNLISNKSGKEIILQSFVVKWDTRPEPWDYDKNKPKIELLPETSEPENFLPEDECTAAIAVKHSDENQFYIYDGNYYVNSSVNQCDEKEIVIRLIFSSSSATTKKDYVIVNRNKSIGGFNLKEIKNS